MLRTTSAMMFWLTLSLPAVAQELKIDQAWIERAVFDGPSRIIDLVSQLHRQRRIILRGASAC